jgi:CrcB protein
MLRAILIALGAGVGAPLRYLIDQRVKQVHKSLIPVETLGINTIGSFILGLMINNHGNWQLIIGTGFAGAFTTWSAFAIETHHLIEQQHYKKATVYLMLTLLLGISAAGFGVFLTK